MGKSSKESLLPMNKTGAVLIAALLTAGPSWGAAPLGIVEVLRKAEETSPELKAALARMKEAGESIRVARAGYYPTLDVEGVDSTGFPGSSGWLGYGGLMGSPFRSGPTGGAVSRFTVFDFGRTFYDTKAAQEEWRASLENVKILRYQVYMAALKLYFDAVRFRSEQETWQSLGKQIDIIAREVRRFVDTGQRSIVDTYLVRDQIEEADATQATYGERYRVALHRLALITGLLETNLSCPNAAELQPDIYAPLIRFEQSPVLRAAAAEAEAARQRLKQVQSENRPLITAVGSAGEMDDARLVDKKDYSAGVGIQLPLFEGYKITGEIRRAQYFADQKDQDLMSARYELDDLSAAYDEIIDSSRINLDHLNHELTVATEGLNVAKDRYFSLQGNLVDLREALRNLERIQTTIDEVRADFYLAEGSKKVLNGAYVPETSHP
jgi:outer membrane protein TolC